MRLEAGRRAGEERYFVTRFQQVADVRIGKIAPHREVVEVLLLGSGLREQLGLLLLQSFERSEPAEALLLGNAARRIQLYRCRRVLVDVGEEAHHDVDAFSLGHDRLQGGIFYGRAYFADMHDAELSDSVEEVRVVLVEYHKSIFVHRKNHSNASSSIDFTNLFC